MGERKPLSAQDEWRDREGRCLTLCVPCETDPEVTHSSQAIVVLRGFSLCRRHLNEWEQFGIFDIPSTN